MRHLSTALAALYAGLIYLFIFLPVVVSDPSVVGWKEVY